MDSYEYTFPVEQWWQILAHVSLGDLCNVVLTSRRMNSMASLPELWAGIKVNREKLRENGLAEFYNIKRFKRVKQVNLEDRQWECGEWERFMKEIPGSHLQNANLSCNDLSGVSAELLASAVSHLHIVNLWGTDLTTDQCVALLKASLSSTTLRNVDLLCVNLSEVPAELLANSIIRLQDVKLCGTDLTTDQCIELLKASLSSATLRNVDLSSVNLSEVPAELLANSISRLQDVKLYRTHLTTDQCIELLKASLFSTTLRGLDLEDISLNEVPAELLANSISRLQDVNLGGTHLTTDQCIELLKASLSSTTLRNIDLSSVNLSEVPAELLANSISRLQDVNLRGTHLTTDQCVELLKAIQSSTTLCYIELRDNYITKIVPTAQQYLLTSLPAHVKFERAIE